MEAEDTVTERRGTHYQQSNHTGITFPALVTLSVIKAISLFKVLDSLLYCLHISNGPKLK